MNKISMDKKYKTRDGRDVRILCVDRKRTFNVVALIGDSSSIIEYSCNGKFFDSGCNDSCDLIEVSPYADIPIDAKVLVWHSGNDKKIKRYFAGVHESGKPMAFASGGTSFSADLNPVEWDFCELYTGE